MAVYFFYGDEDFNIELELNKLSAELNPDFKSMSLKVYDNPAFNTLIGALRTTPMMFGKMLTIIYAEQYFAANKNFFEDSELSEIDNALANISDSINIVFVFKLPRGENKKPDSRKKLYKILSKYNVQEFPTFKTYKTAEIAAWVKKQAKTKDIIVNDDVANILIEHIGNNLREFDTELDKLKLIAYPEKTITPKMVSDICISNEDLFTLAEFLMNGNKTKALIEYNKLLDKKHPLEILSALQTMLKKWIILKSKSALGSYELSKLTGQHEFVVKQTLQKLKNTNIAELVKLKQNLHEAEFKIKNAESLDIESEVGCAIIR